MGTSAPKFTLDGSINPEWMQYISNKDQLVGEIAAFVLSGEKIRLGVNCMASVCHMPNRTSIVAVDDKIKVFNPMIFCYFCDRTFHMSCMDLDSNLIKTEPVPWRCSDCKKDLQTSHCQDYYKATNFASKLIERRARFLVLSKAESENEFKGDVNFRTSDLESFKRRALKIMQEEDDDAEIDIGEITPLVVRQVMKARADANKAKEMTSRFQQNLDAAQREIKSLSISRSGEINKANTTHSQMDSTVNFGQAALSSTMHGGVRANPLTTFYTSQLTVPPIEVNDFVYRPDPTRPNIANTTQQSQNASHSRSWTDNDVSTLLTRLTVSQERTEERQLLEARRRAKPNITQFDGDESKWLTFKQDIERYRLNCQFDDETVKMYMRGALKGEAYDVVRDIFDTEPLDTILAILKNAYGDEMRIVRARSEELRNFKFNSALCKSEAVKLQAAMQAYFAACRYANIGYINTNILAETVFNQFNTEDRLRCKEFYRHKYPAATTIVLDVETIYEFILDRIPLLDDAPPKKKVFEAESKSKHKNYQVQSISDNSTIGDGKGYDESYKFDIKDKIKAVYIGYDMDKVATLSKDCPICGSSNHFALQCSAFKEIKAPSERMKLANEHKLCRNCLLTSAHVASDCDVKVSCGYKLNKTSRCTAKHHIALHDASGSTRERNYGYGRKRHSNTSKNSANALDRIDRAKKDASNDEGRESSGSLSLAFHALDPKSLPAQRYELFSIGEQLETPKSVKAFNVIFHGPNGRVKALVVGDSGSEVTIMRDDLRQVLGIKGNDHSHTLNLSWADKSTRSWNAISVDVEIQGTGEGMQKYRLRNCYATDELDLPTRSLDMDKLRKQFPYLRKVPFEGYCQEQPVMLIGAPHAFLIEGCELVDNGSDGPVGIRTKIGWSVYGGMRNSDISNMSVKTVNEESNPASDRNERRDVSNEDLHDLLTRHFSIEALGIREKEFRHTENEQKALDILNEEMKVLENGSLEAPLVWNRRDGKIPSLPNNYPLVKERQLAQERKLRLHPERLTAFNENVKEMIDSGFLREANDTDMGGKWTNIWYLPMSLIVNENKNPPKMRNVYDASSKYKGTSLNDNLLKGPDLLVNILQPLLRMRVNSIAFTADVKAMFNMIKICPRDQQCQRILWRESHDQPFKTYVSEVMMFGMNSSPLTSQVGKNKTAEKWRESYPQAAQALIEFTYMDDLLTSEPNVQEAIKVAEQCIEICGSINWQLVSFQSNSSELLKALPSSAVKKDVIPLLEDENSVHVTKVLGCFWNTTEDCFQFRLDENIFIKLVNDFDERPTKRDQASTIARIYDVLGLISHFTIRGRILMQRSWANKLKWDEQISEQDAKEWKNWLAQINDVAQLKFPRRFTQFDALCDADVIQLHVFCDAGTEAYGTVAYLVVQTGETREV